ncbi:hypothetical protein XH88_21805 [Bradyrhizobium sp. CCBAU 51627]|nr:hypothetical protein [Bradyrhizobium sp. CCBAU 51627]
MSGGAGGAARNILSAGGTGGAGLRASGSSTIVNMAGLTGGIGGAGLLTSGAGGVGAALTGSGLQFTNSGSITGGAGGVTPGFVDQGNFLGGTNGAGGVALSVASGNAVTLAGSVAGGEGGNSGTASTNGMAFGAIGGAGGAGLMLTGSLLTFGAGSSIIGGAGGSGSDAISTGATVQLEGATGGAGGAGGTGAVLDGNGLSIAGSGPITGGSGGSGGAATVSSSSAAAIGGAGGAGGVGLALSGRDFVFSDTGSINGGAGGNGGAGNILSSGTNSSIGTVGGAGGAGGMGLALSGSNFAFTATGSINGGAGGNGAAATTPSSGASAVVGGAGGAGGVGAALNANGLVFTDSGSINGGAGGNGAAGISGSSLGGAGGAGGAALTVTAGSTVALGGGVSGGNGGNGGSAVLLAGGVGGDGGIGISLASGTLTLGALVRGGNGGVGGDATGTLPPTTAGDVGGAGGAGGTGLSMGGGTVTINSGGGVSGGAGGAAGAGSALSQAPGAGGVGIAGLNLAIVDAGTITGGLGGDGLTQANAITFSGGVNSLTLLAGSIISGNVVAVSGGTDTLALGGSGNSSFNASLLGTQYQNFATFQKTGASVWTLTGVNTFAGATMIDSGTLLAGNAGAFSATSATTIRSGGTLDLGGFVQTINVLSLAGGTIQNGNLSGVISSTGGTINGIGGSASVLASAGTTTIVGVNGYSGATTISGGTLVVNGSIANSSIVTVNSGGTLSGTGIVDPATTTIMSAGVLRPGNTANPTGTLTITGNLAFQSGALYAVQVTPSAAASTTVFGVATLGGATVNAQFAPGGSLMKRYTILTAGSINGAFDPNVVNTNADYFSGSLSYDATHVFLNLSLTFAGAGGLSGNQQAVAHAISSFFDATGSVPMAFADLTASGLTQASGETATGSQQITFNAMGLFMGVMTDPFMERSAGMSTSQHTRGYADEALGYARASKIDAFAMFTKAPPVQNFEQRWNVWAAGFGGSQSTLGNVVVGSNNTNSNIGATAVGADYLISPNTVAGFALGGGGTSFSVANGGSGRSDLFQFGAYVRHMRGPAYVSTALAYGWQDVTTDRTVTGRDQLHAEFNANAWSGRFEGGYRFVSPTPIAIGITPYAAAQSVILGLPAYAERAISGASNFALSYGAKDVVDVRSEIGYRTDKSFLIPTGVLTLRGRLAWAHDFSTERNIAATFQSLPVSSFVVNGAAQAADLALTTASIEMKWRNGWSAVATLEGEFSNVTNSYAGKGVVRYQW